MGQRVFVSYSTDDIAIAQGIKRHITSPEVEVFVADHSIMPGEILPTTIKTKIKSCNLFLLLWTHSARQSDWVQQEIGIAYGHNKIIIPFVLDSDLSPVGFIKDIKYIRGGFDLDENLTLIRKIVGLRVGQPGFNTALFWTAVAGLAAGLLFGGSEDNKELSEN